MNPVLVQVPCRRFQVAVKLGPPDGIGRLESLLLRRLGLGAATVEEIATLFSLPESIVLDRIVGLLRRGLVTLQTDTGQQRLHLSDSVRAAMGEPEAPTPEWASKLGLPGPVTKEVTLYREMVSGTVFARPRRDDGRWEHRLPVTLDLCTVDEIPKPILLSAASSKLREERTGMKSLRAFDVVCTTGLQSPSTSGPVESFAYVVVEVVGSKLDEEQPLFSVVGPSTLSRRVRDAIADGIANLHQRRQVDELVRALSSRGGEGVEGTRAVEQDGAELAARLREHVAGVALDVSADMLEVRHMASVAIAQELDELLSSEAAYEGRAELVLDPSTVRARLLSALRKDAELQIVIATPNVSGLARDDEMQQALIEAVSRNVRVHLLWGGQHAKSADDIAPFGNLLELLRPGDQRVGGLFVSERPAGLHGSAFACDMRYVIVGSFDWFGGKRSGGRSVGAILPSILSKDVETPRTKVPTTVIETLQALQRACPEAALRRVISADPILDGGTTILRARSPMAFPSLPISTYALSVKVWKKEWESWLRDLESTQRSDVPTVRLIPRGGHRRQLVRAFEHARRRVVLMSPRLGDGALGAALEPYVTHALERGVEVSFAYRDVLPRDDLTRRLRMYREQGMQTKQTDIDASFVVCDDRAIVSSFLFGSSDGERGLLELGFDIRDAEIAAQLVELVGSTSAPVHVTQPPNADPLEIRDL